MKRSHPCFTNSPLHKCLVRLRAARQHRDVLLHDGALGAAQAAHPGQMHSVHREQARAASRSSHGQPRSNTAASNPSGCFSTGAASRYLKGTTYTRVHTQNQRMSSRAPKECLTRMVK